jgi:NAD dependent epimerase/dehydratase family enzyme
MSHNYIHKPKKDNIKKTKTLMDNSSKLNSTLDEDLAMARETIQAQEAELEEKMEIINSKISENEALKEKISDFERIGCRLFLLILKL